LVISPSIQKLKFFEEKPVKSKSNQSHPVESIIVYVRKITMVKRSTSKKAAASEKPLVEESPELSPVDSGEDEESSVYDSDAYSFEDNEDGSDDEANDDDDADDDDGFEDQGSSDEDETLLEKQERDDEGSDDEDIAVSYEKVPRTWKAPSRKKSAPNSGPKSAAEETKASEWVHTDDWSSDEDDEEGKGNRIGRVPIHWYDEYEHVGYDAHGQKVAKSGEGGDRIDQAIAMADNMAQGKFVVYDALNDKNVELSKRQLELIRRVQSGAYAHPEHDATPDYIDYFSGVNQEISGLNSDRYEPKARFQPSKWEKLQVERLLEKLEKGQINMDYLTGKIRDMNDANGKVDPNKPFPLWKGDEEDLLSMRKGPQHISAPKLPPPGHAESYVPPDEYLPTEEDLKKWEEMDPKDRPHGHLIPKKFPNLRSVGAYQHSVREAFERCLDLYLCPRVMKRRLNIDPESLVPRLPKASDLRPFPTARCIEYETPYEGDVAPIIRCVTPSPDGQFMASGASDGFVRLWEVQTGRLLRSWDLTKATAGLKAESSDEDNAIKPVVCVEWNPSRSHHCLLAVVGTFVVVIATGTAGKHDAETTEAILFSAQKGGNVSSEKAGKAVKWTALQSSKNDRPVSSFDGLIGPVCALQTNREVVSVRWQSKGDYFVSVSPKAQSAAVLIHQLSKGNSQQPFSKSKGEAQLACFHPNKPFLFVASQQHIRVYHLVKQTMVKRLSSGCRWISSLDIHPTGDHLIVGSLDRRMVWFDLDLSSSPFKTLKYHERALRSCKFHGRYPLMASASDDGAVHVFHSMVYSDLMRNPLVVPVKILRGHTITKKLGVLTVAFHPTQPWLFTGGADGKIFLFQDI
jgi:ribosome biogenesis protein ERB1